ncbi:MAG: ATP-dependent helicase [Candidatus Paceibacterota bacterium]
MANILAETDTAPESILALTFTDSAVTAMRERLRQYIGSRAYRVTIATFHSFAAEIIRQYPDSYEHITGARPASDIERITIIEDILKNPDFKLLRPAGDPGYYIKPLLGQISELKREYVVPEQLAQIIAREEAVLTDIPRYHESGAHKGKERGEYQKKAKQIEKNRELLAVYQQYQAALQTARLFDYDDMITETIAVLEQQEDVLRDLQEMYQYILADEHQDVNGSQNQLLTLLASYHDQPNIFAVGDEKQAIYRFQGASLENFLAFTDAYADTTTIALTTNYRSGQTILDAAHSLIAVPDGPLKDLRLPLTAHTDNDSAVVVQEFSHEAVEDAWVVDSVAELIEAGTDPAEIAVIVRTNKEVESYACDLRAAGVPTSASAESDILTHPLTLEVRNLITAVVTPADESALFAVLHGSYWGIEAGDLVKVLQARSLAEPLANLVANQDVLQSLGV